jgi:hypothetical protein
LVVANNRLADGGTETQRDTVQATIIVAQQDYATA